MRGKKACMVKGGHVWQWGGACVAMMGTHGKGHAWQGGVHGRVCVCVCVAGGRCAWHGGVHGQGGGMHDEGGVCGKGGMCGKGGGMHSEEAMCGRGMHGRGHAWQERRPLQRTLRILLECILV